MPGYQYIEALTERLKNIKFDKAYSSTSNRTKKTIAPLAKLNNLEIIQDENLCEMYFGIYDGWKWEDVNKVNPNISKLHKDTNKIMGIPEQETTEQVEKRIYDCIEKIAKENIGKNVLICSHGIAIETFLRKINNEKFTENIDLYGQRNTSINVLEYDSEKNKFKVLILNDFSHLK